MELRFWPRMRPRGPYGILPLPEGGSLPPARIFRCLQISPDPVAEKGPQGHRGKQIIAANMKLTGTEAEKFWPIYEAYVNKFVTINKTKYDLLKRYVAGYDSMSDQDAQNSVGQWVGVDQSVAQLRLKYIPIYRKVLSARNTALFFQLDRRIQLMIDLQLVSQLPAHRAVVRVPMQFELEHGKRPTCHFCRCPDARGPSTIWYSCIGFMR